MARDAKTSLLDPSKLARVCERAMLRMLDRLSEAGAEGKVTTGLMKRPRVLTRQIALQWLCTHSRRRHERPDSVDNDGCDEEDALEEKTRHPEG